ncbi:type B chloramphenicol O-acetyltransferase, partial [Xanthomonas citri pv. citri]
VAAKSVVTRDVPPYAIVAGNPATVVRMRVPPEVAERLLAVAWWDWTPERITRCLPASSGGDVAVLEAEGARIQADG